MKKILNKLLRILAGVIILPILFFIVIGTVRFFACGPDREVVKVASPVAKIIADDILKNGIPKSLKDIDGLPYKLEGCKREEKFEDRDGGKVAKNKAFLAEIQERCSFSINKKKYKVSIWFAMHFIDYDSTHGFLTIFNGATSTGIDYNFDYSKKANQLILEKSTYANPLIYDGKTSGVCSTFRQ